MVAVSLRGVVKRFGDHQVVHGIDLEIAANEFVVLVGPSGCGKSTILRMIAGLEDISDGEIATDGRVVNELAPKDRDIAMVFQDYALYPHLTVQRNMSFGLEMQKLPKAEIRQRVEAAADILNIRNLLDRKPKALSGGQRQRVAMGRAIVRRPKVFLFDEPLSNLDAKLRTQMRTEIKKLHKALATTIIYVTHDQVEAMTLADRVVVLRDGHIEQIGTPDEIYNAPRSLFVAGFVGAPTMNFIPARLAGAGDGAVLRLEDGTVLPLDDAQRARFAAHLDRDVILGLRPEFFSVAEPARAALTPRINVVEPMGSDTLFYFQIGATELVARTPPLSGLHPGDELPLQVDLRRLHLFDPVTEEVL